MLKTISKLALLGLLALQSLPSYSSGGEPAGYTETEHPVVLVHGVIGWDAILGVYDYWYGIEGALEADGATVYVANVPAMNDDTARGEALIAYLEELQAIHGHNKFNLLAHSQGALTSRYAAANSDLVVSVSSTGGANYGSKMGDLLSGALNFPTAAEVIASIVEAFSFTIDATSGNAGASEDAIAALKQLNSEGAAQFNALYPAGQPSTYCGSTNAVASNGISYYSMGGADAITNPLDPFNFIASAGGAFFTLIGEQSDGVIQRCSTHWGEVIRDDYNLNHADLINQTLGLMAIYSQDPKEIYRTHLNRLKNAGL